MNFAQGTSLDAIRQELVRLEDTIIFALIERANFAHNQIIYSESFPNASFSGSFLDYFFFEIESAHAKVRRYTSPDEYSFTSMEKLPAPILPPLEFPKILAPNNVNVNSELKDIYIKTIVPRISRDGDDLNYGSSATKDYDALQALSRRIHFGKFVAEAKFQDPIEQPNYVEHIKAKDRVKIEELLTNKVVEERVLRRLKRKAQIYGQEIEDGTTSLFAHDDQQGNRLPIDVVVELYKDSVIPLTKRVEVEYLLQRLDPNNNVVKF